VEIDPRRTLAGERVQFRIVETTYVTKQTGTKYDCREAGRPLYTTTTHTTTLPPEATTAADGTFRLRLVRGGDAPKAIATHRDGAGHTIMAGATGETAGRNDEWSLTVLVRPGTDELGRVRGRRHGPCASLWAARTPGLSPVHGHVPRPPQRQGPARGHLPGDLRLALVPDAQISGVRFTGSYETARSGRTCASTAGRWTRIARTPLTGPASCETATIETRPELAPVAARSSSAPWTKLFAMGAASADDPLRDSYQSTGDGQLATAIQPHGRWRRRQGDTTGGGDGRGIRDCLVAMLVHTQRRPRHAGFDLSDDLTSWGSSAVTADLRPASERPGSPSRPVLRGGRRRPGVPGGGLPVIRVRAYGAALRERGFGPVHRPSGTVPLTALTRDGTAFRSVEVELPSMPAGTHRPG
jgi:hypothetical protein